MAVYRGRVHAGFCRNLAGEKTHDDAVFVRCPCSPIPAEEGSSRAFLSAKSTRTVEETVHKPFEADRYLIEPPSRVHGNTVNHGCGDQCFSHCRFLSPCGSVPEKVVYRDREEVVGIHKPSTPRDNPVTIDVRIIAEGDIKIIL